MNGMMTYERTIEFTGIPSLQKAYTLTYGFTIVPYGANFHAITKSESQDKPEMISFLYCNADYNAAFNLLTFLCENTISLSCCFDILHDYNIPVSSPNFNMTNLKIAQ